MRNPKRLFLIDAAGALLSSFFLGTVLRRFESTFGVQQDILLFLALLPILFAAFDFYAYFEVKGNWRRYIKVIAILNSIYCCITIGLLFYDYERLTVWGVSYFVAELLVLFVLIGIEFKASAKKIET